MVDCNNAEPHPASQHALMQYTWSHHQEHTITLARLDRFYCFKQHFSIFNSVIFYQLLIRITPWSNAVLLPWISHRRVHTGNLIQVYCLLWEATLSSSWLYSLQSMLNNSSLFILITFTFFQSEEEHSPLQPRCRQWWTGQFHPEGSSCRGSWVL